MITGTGALDRGVRTPYNGAMRRAPLIPAALLALIACTPVVATEAVLAPEIAAPVLQPLTPLFKALAALEAGTAAEPVVMMQIGDSHTANDAFAGRLRELFQERFGAAGRGLLPPGIPYQYYRPAQVTVSQAGPWTFRSSLKPSAKGPFSLTGFRLSPDGPGAVVTVESTEPEGFDRVALELAARPGGGGGVPAVTIDGVPAEPAAQAGGFVAFPAPPGSRTLEIRADRTSADLLSVVVERRRPGVVYENQGIIGATVEVQGRWDPDRVRAALAFRRPALIVVAYGTNEGFNDSLDPIRYAAAYERRVKALQAAAPDAAIVVMGPPDANRCSGPSRGKVKASCVPLTAEEGRNDAELFQGKPKGEACRWHPPPKLAVVREIQRRLAPAQGWLFWDWERAMGGPCSIDAWTRRDPPLALGDHVHLRAAGYRLTADILFAELMDRYARYKDAVIAP